MNFPLAVLRSSYWVCSGYATAIILRGRDCSLIHANHMQRGWRGVHHSRMRWKNQTNSPPKMYDWILSAKYWILFILGGVYRSDASLTVQVHSCVFCTDIRPSPAQQEAQLRDGEAAQQKYQSLHNASWSLMGLLWQRDAQDERLVQLQ